MPYHIIPVTYCLVPYISYLYHTIPVTYYTILCHTVPYRTIPYHTVPYHTTSYTNLCDRKSIYHTSTILHIPYRTTPYVYHTIPYHIIPYLYHTIPYNTIRYLYDTIPYLTISDKGQPYLQSIPLASIRNLEKSCKNWLVEFDQQKQLILIGYSSYLLHIPIHTLALYSIPR